MKKVIIIGGGVAGLISAIQLVNSGIETIVFEKKNYPQQKVCGEYISNETVPFLRRLAIYPEEFSPPQIQRLLLTSVNGRSVELPLDMGGFGISRFTFDHFLYRKAIDAGVTFHLSSEVESVVFKDQLFVVKAAGQLHTAGLVIGAFGKRSRMDVTLSRSFIHKRSPYVGVKYHIQTLHDPQVIALHNFKDGYCGISNVEDGKTNLCYLTHRHNLKTYKDVRQMEEAVLFRNPFLKKNIYQYKLSFRAA